MPSTGLPKIQGDETIELALYPFDASPEVLRDRTRSVGKAKVRGVKPTESTLDISGVSGLSQDMTFKAVITSLPMPAIAVRLEGESEGAKLVESAIAKAGPAGKGSLYIREARPGESPEFRLRATNGQYIIAGPANDRPLVDQIDGFTETTARKAVERLEHMARWTLTSRFNNPESTIKGEDVELEILQGSTPLTGSEIRLEYKPVGGKITPPKFKVKVTNKGDRELWIALLDLTQNYKVSADFQQSGSSRLKPGESFSPFGGKEVTATVPDLIWQQGVVEYKDILKLIVCTDEFDATTDGPVRARSTPGHATRHEERSRRLARQALRPRADP